MPEDENISELVSWFFDKINVPYIENQYIDDIQNWDALCASLTLLNDLQRAKSEYSLLPKINHLEVIGIMQTIYIEQDTVLTLWNAILTESHKELDKYSTIRHLRNEVFGHPSKKSNKGFFSRHFFDIKDSKQQIIKIINWKDAGNIDSSHFNLSSLVEENSRITREYLDDIKTKFIQKIEQNMGQYKINISELFKMSSYVFEKILTKKHDRIVIDSFHCIDDDLEKAKEGLIERKLFEDYEREYNVLVFFSTKLKPLFNIQTFADTEFYAYALSLRTGIDSFKKSLQEIEKPFSDSATGDPIIVFK